MEECFEHLECFDHVERHLYGDAAEIFEFILHYTEQLTEDLVKGKTVESLFSYKDVQGYKNKQTHFTESDYFNQLDTHDKILKHGIKFIDTIYDAYRLKPDICKLYQLYLMSDVPVILSEMLAHVVRRYPTEPLRISSLIHNFAERLHHKHELMVNKYTEEVVECILKEKFIQCLDDQIILDQFLQEQKLKEK